MKKLNLGVIGSGMGRTILRINGRDDFQTEVRSICDIDANKLSKMQDEFQIEHVTTDWKELTQRDDLDIIGVFSPDHLHFEMIKGALEAGKHVIVTKPMVISLAEAMETVRLVRKHQRKLLVGQTRRFESLRMAAKEFYDTGKLGTPLMAQATYYHDMRTVFDRTPWRYEHPKDFLYGGACHPIDELRWFLGDVDEVSAMATRSIDPRYPSNKEANFMLNLRFKNGAIARVLNAQGVIDTPKAHRKSAWSGFAICGDKGTLVGAGDGYYVRYEEDGEVHDLKLPGTPVGIDFDGKEDSGHVRAAMRYVQEMEHCILNDSTPSVNEIDGAKCTSVSEAAWESIRTGRNVKVFNEFEELEASVGDSPA